MCEKTREAKGPFRRTTDRGVTYITDADGRDLAAMAAPLADAKGPLTKDEMKQFIADNSALFIAAPKMAQYIRAEVISAVCGGSKQQHVMPELRLLAEAMNTSVEFEWQKIERAVEAQRAGDDRLAA